MTGTAPAPLTPRSHEESGDLVEQLLACWQVLPSIPQQEIDDRLAAVLRPNDHGRLRHCWLAVLAFAKAQVQGYRPLLDALRDNGLRYSLLKGSATAAVLYPEPWMRAAWDLDIGVDAASLRDAESLADRVGYRPAQQDPRTHRFYRSDASLRASVEARHYELGFLVRRLQVTNLDEETLEAIRSEPWTHRFWFDVETDAPWCYASVDIHHAISLDIPLDDLLSHTHEALLDGRAVKLPSDAWLAAYLVFKLYWEGVHSYGKGLHGYADLLRLVPRLDHTSFGSLVDILGRFNLIAAGYYVMRRLPAFGVAAAEPIASFLDQAATPAHGRNDDPLRANDLGDMWFKLWGRR